MYGTTLWFILHAYGKKRASVRILCTHDRHRIWFEAKNWNRERTEYTSSATQAKSYTSAECCTGRAWHNKISVMQNNEKWKAQLCLYSGCCTHTAFAMRKSVEFCTSLLLVVAASIVYGGRAHTYTHEKSLRNWKIVSHTHTHTDRSNVGVCACCVILEIENMMRASECETVSIKQILAKPTSAYMVYNICCVYVFSHME